MKTLLEKLNFSVKKPINGEQFHTFKIDNAVLIDVYSTFYMFCKELEIDLSKVGVNDFNSSVKFFEDYYKDTKMKLTIKGVDEITSYFWIKGD